jgi:hypothetical protein
MRKLYVGALALGLAACESVLGIDGQFESVPQAFCTGAANACASGQLAGFDESTCEGVIPSGVKFTDYTSCEKDAGCVAFVQCLQNVADLCTASSTTNRGMPCTADGPCCTCNAPDGGVSLCQ